MSMHGTFFQITATLVVAVLVSSCASEKKVTQSRVRKDPWGHEVPFTVGKDADGNPVMKSDRRSEFENRSSNIARNRDFSGRDYTSKSYRKERWGGNKSFIPKKFQGATDATSRYQKEPWFIQKQAQSFATQARVSNKQFSVKPYRAQNLSYKQGVRMLPMPPSVQEVNKGSAMGQIPITNWKDQKGLSVKDTNNMLGR